MKNKQPNKLMQIKILTNDWQANKWKLWLGSLISNKSDLKGINEWKIEQNLWHIMWMDLVLMS